MTPARLGPYVILSVMGQGGSGIVTKCRHERTGGLLAVKRARDTSALQRDSMRKEISMLTRLGRAGDAAVVRVVESGNDGGLLWYAMEYIEGPDLAAVIQFFRRGVMQVGAASDTASVTTHVRPSDVERTTTGLATFEEPLVVGGGGRTYAAPPSAVADADTIPPNRLTEALDVMRRVTQSVAFVHQQGVVHGDLKPPNMLFREDGSSVLVDFGAAIYAFAGATPREVAQVEGLRHGTPGYMAPEQILGEPLDARSDLYALGCILYEIAAGRRPFAADNVSALQSQHLYVTPPPPSELAPGIPPELDALVLRLLAKDPRKRIGYAEDVLAALSSLLGVEPSSEARLPSPRHFYRPRVAGRTLELGRLRARLECARDGHGGGVAYVAGESGVGKTRLVNELGGIAVGSSMDVVVGQCSELSRSSGRAASLRGAALQPFIPLLHRLLDRCSMPDGRGLAAELKAELATLSPYETSLLELEEVASHRLFELPFALARTRVFRSLVDVLRRLGEERPLLLVLDDLHWADDLTLAFLQSNVVHELAKTRVLLVGTFREEQVDEALRAVASADPERVVRLGRLSLEATRSMAKDMLASELMPEGLDEFLHRHSEGNPFFAAEYLRAAIERGVLSRSVDGRWSAPALAPDDFRPSRDSEPPAVPESLQELLRLRLEGLSPGAAAALQLVSVLGRDIDLERLDAFRKELELQPMSGEALAIEELVARQILEASGPLRYRFVHDKLREAAEASIPRERRQSLHATAARRLESASRAGSASALDDARLGHHWAAADEPALALPYLERAARAACQVHLNTQAIELYLSAIAQTEALAGQPAVEPRALRKIGEDLADLLAQVARHADARRYYEWALTRGDPADRLGAARLCRKKAQSFWTLHQYQDATRELDRALQHLGDRDALSDPRELEEWIEIEQGRFWRHYFARETGERTRAIVERMQSAVEAYATPVQRSVYYVCVALDRLGRGRYTFDADAVASTREAVQVLADEPSLLTQACLARFNLGFALLLGDRASREEAIVELERTAHDSERLGDVTLLSRALTYLAVGHRRLGDARAAARSAERALRASEDARLAPYIGASLACLAWVNWKRNEHVLAERRAAEARQWWQSSGHDFPFRWLAAFLLLDVAVRKDELEAARDLLAELTDERQQALPAELAALVQRALREDLDYRELSATIQRVLKVAEGEGYL